MQIERQWHASERTPNVLGVVSVMKDKSVAHQFSRVEAPGELVRAFKINLFDLRGGGSPSMGKGRRGSAEPGSADRRLPRASAAVVPAPTTGQLASR